MATRRHGISKPSFLGLIGDVGTAAAVVAAWILAIRVITGVPVTLNRIAGSAAMALVLGTLISLLRQAYITLESSEKTWREALRGISDGIGIVRTDRSILWANPEAAKLAGVPEDVLTGMRCDRAWECGRGGCQGCTVDRKPLMGPVHTVNSVPGHQATPDRKPPASYPRKDGTTSLVVFPTSAESSPETQELRRQLATLKVQLRESAHRTKNNLQMVASLVSLTDPAENRDALDELEQRIRLMGLVHEQLTVEKDEDHASLQRFLSVLSRAVLDSLTPPHLLLSLSCTAPEWEVPARRAVSLGLIVNELITNSIKHGFTGRLSGKIEITGRADEGFLELCYSDDGNGFGDPDPDAPPGSGTHLIGLIVGQLGGTMSVPSGTAAGGYRVAITIPVTQLK